MRTATAPTTASAPFSVAPSMDRAAPGPMAMAPLTVAPGPMHVALVMTRAETVPVIVRVQAALRLAPPADPRYAGSPEYVAFREWTPGASALVANVACLLTRETMPRVIEPSVKVTDPVGVPVLRDGGATVAFSVAVWPKVVPPDTTKAVDVPA